MELHFDYQLSIEDEHVLYSLVGLLVNVLLPHHQIAEVSFYFVAILEEASWGWLADSLVEMLGGALSEEVKHPLHVLNAF